MAGGSHHRITTFDGLSLFVRIYSPPHAATHPSVLCLPGLSRNGKDFHDLATRLSRRRNVLCPDYRGVGQSDYAANHRSYCPQAWIADIHHILAATNQHRVAVMGTSFGGVLAAAMTVSMPCAVAGVVLNDIGPDVAPGGLEKVLAHIGTQRRFADWSEAVDYMKKTFPNLPATNEERWQRIARNTFREDGGFLVNDWDTKIARSVPGMRRDAPDLWPVFKALSRFPGLSVRGEKSDILSERTHRRMAEEIPGLELITAPGVGHAPDLAEAPLADEIEVFLDSLR